MRNDKKPQRSGNSTGLLMGGINVAATSVEITPSKIRLPDAERRPVRWILTESEENSVELHAVPVQQGNHPQIQK